MKGRNSLYPKSPIALTILSAVGVIGTAVTAVRATPKALKIIEEEFEDIPPTKKEAIRATWKCYIPATIIGVATIGCIIGSTSISYKSQVSLISAYTLLERSFKEYKDKVKEMFGEDGEREVKASIVRDHFMEGDKIPTPMGEKLIFYIDHCGDFFCIMHKSLAADAFQCIIQKVGIDLTLQRTHLCLRFQDLCCQFQLRVTEITFFIQQIHQKCAVLRQKSLVCARAAGDKSPQQNNGAKHQNDRRRKNDHSRRFYIPLFPLYDRNQQYRRQGNGNQPYHRKKASVRGPKVKKMFHISNIEFPVCRRLDAHDLLENFAEVSGICISNALRHFTHIV